MPRYVYVPQCRVGRYHEHSSQWGFDGLYTDGFTTCHILAVMGSNGRAFLAHIDHMFPFHLLIDEMQWVGADCQIVIFRREGESLIPIIQVIEEAMHRKATQIVNVGDQEDGILMTKSEDGQFFRCQTRPLRDVLPGVIHHPEERFFQTTTKIQVLYWPVYSDHPRIKPVIFDGHYWCGVADAELKPKMTDPNPRIQSAIQRYWQHISDRHGTVIYTSGVIAGVIVKISEETPGLQLQAQAETLGQDLAYPVNIFLENFDALKLFNMDITEAIPARAKEVKSPEDVAINKKLQEMLKRRAGPEEYRALLVELERLPDPNPGGPSYLGAIRLELRDALGHYDRCMIYVNQLATMKAAKERANTCAVEGAQRYKAHDYAAAEACFRESITHAHVYMTDKDSDLSNLYYNLGRSIQMQTERNAEALKAFTLCYRIRQKTRGGEHADTRKVKAVIDELVAAAAAVPASLKAGV